MTRLNNECRKRLVRQDQFDFYNAFHHIKQKFIEKFYYIEYLERATGTAGKKINFSSIKNALFS